LLGVWYWVFSAAFSFSFPITHRSPLLDMLCGHAAGNITVLLLNDHNRENKNALDHAHLLVESIDELNAHLIAGISVASHHR
jgi:hypothetical protein